MTLERALLAFGGVVTILVGLGLAWSPHDLAETCRVVNVPLATAVAAGFFLRINDAWHRYGLGGRLTRLGILAILAVVAGGSAEAYVTHAQLGIRSVLMTLALTLTACGLALIPRDDS